MLIHSVKTDTHDNARPRNWGVYVCKRCGGLVTYWISAGRTHESSSGYFPGREELNNEIPERVREYLQQAIDSVAAPVGSIMLCASAVDAMLKAKNYKSGSLYSRIDQAAKDNIITADMAKWAHSVRLDANDQRHADELASLPTGGDAEGAIDFTRTLAEILFVLPARIRAGLASPGTAP